MVKFLRKGRFEYTRTGDFRCCGRFEIISTAVGLGMSAAGAVYAALMVLLDLRLIEYLDIISDIVIIWILFWVFIIRIGRSGVTYHYEADDDEFRITDNKNRTEYFFYSDITDIEYLPIYHFNGKIRGYHVKINNGIRIIEYNFIAHYNAIITGAEDTPFHILEERARSVQRLLPGEAAAQSSYKANLRKGAIQ